MIKVKQLVFFALILFIIVVSCNKDDKYERPQWLEGKLYTQLKLDADLSTFAYCLEKSEIATLIDKSGSYTVFAPTNEAFQSYFSSNSKQYKSVDDIPMDELKELVKYHIIQNPWNSQQLRKLDVYGWIDTLDENNDKPRGFKRETVLLEPNHNYGVTVNFNQVTVPSNYNRVMIVDSTETSWHRKVATDYRKFAPIFYQEYFNAYELPLSDYGFYFDRQFEDPNDLFYVNGRVIDKEVFAENGFIYKIDRVVEPLKNADEILKTTKNGNSYLKTEKLINNFSVFTFNQTKTNAQEGAESGAIVDSLFDLTYPNLAFSITNEKISASSYSQSGVPSDISIRGHNGLVAPTDAAFTEFANSYLGGKSIDALSYRIRRIIANSWMSINPIYPSDMAKGFYNGAGDFITLNEGDIVQKEFGSNCTFIGVKNAIVPRAFKSITGPIYTNSENYNTMMNAIEVTGLLSALKRPNQNYMLFAVPDQALRADSSLLLESTSTGRGYILETYYGYVGAGLDPKVTRSAKIFTASDLRTLLMNQVGIERPKGIANKEFIKNLAGNYIIINNKTGEVSGTTPSTFGYQGSTPVTIYPKQISTNADNGITYSISNWLSTGSNELYIYLSANYPEFNDLLVKAGLASKTAKTYSFISSSQYYTVFAPTKEALEAANASALTGDQLKKFLMLHFVQGAMIFTDGNQSAGYYETTRVDEKSTEFSSVYSKIYINPGIDKITFYSKNGDEYFNINESSKTNVITTRSLSSSSSSTPAFTTVLSTGVVHQIETALMFDQLDTK